MSTPAVVRVTAGTPEGGRFASANRPEADVSLPAPAAQLPAWEDLEARLGDAVTEWATNLEEGDHEVEFSDLIGDGDEDAMIEAYGEGRSDYLYSVTFRAQAEDRNESGSRYQPTEYGMVGRLQVMSSDRQLFRSRFTHEDGPDISGLLNHCVTGPDGATTVQTQHQHAYGQLKEIRNPRTGELTDGPDGTAAIRSYDRDNNLREETHLRNGVKHGSSMTSEPDGCTVLTQFQRGVIADGPNLEPAIKTTHPDGSVTREHRPKGVWARTIDYDKDTGQVTSQNVADKDTGGTVRTNFDGAGRTAAIRLDAQGIKHDGPNGEPAVEFRRPGGTVSSHTWYTNGAWTRTRDYNSAGETVVEFNNG